jgi:hypothetical protein
VDSRFVSYSEVILRPSSKVSEKRISPRLAGVMAYFSSLHLRTLAVLDRDDDKVTIIMDGPRPIRD